MRCPHCAGEIPVGSRFCGICGGNVGGAADSSVPGREPGAGSGPPPADPSSMSLFALPVSRGARLARLFVILALDLVLAGAGLAMIFAYLGERRSARDTAAESADAGPVGQAKAQTAPARAAGAASPAKAVKVESKPEGQ